MVPEAWYSSPSTRPALILYRPNMSGGLWDPESARMEERLEDELDIFVASAGPGRGVMALGDAAAAARFSGFDAAVVVSPVGCEPPDHELLAAAGKLRRRVTQAQAEWAVADVVAAYHRACDARARAA